MIFAQFPTRPRKCDTYNSLGFWDTNKSQISVLRPDLVLINNKRMNFCLEDFVVSADHRVKIKESEKQDKYLDLDRELNKQWKIRVTLVPIIVIVPGKVPKYLDKRLGELYIREGILHKKLYWYDQLEYWEESWRPEVIFCHFCERPQIKSLWKTRKELKNHQII